jgi:hypothetical protein
MYSNDRTELAKKNHKRLVKLLDNIPGRRGELAKLMMEDLQERFCIAPASHKKQFHAAYPGGLMHHSINVCINLLKMAKTHYPDRWDDGQLIFVALFHDIGKIGNLKEDQYVFNSSKWHQERGIYYGFNDDIQFMLHAHRSLYLLQHYDIKLTEEEYVAILTHDGMHLEANQAYSQKQPPLALTLHFADMLAVQQEKEMEQLESEEN